MIIIEAGMNAKMSQKIKWIIDKVSKSLFFHSFEFHGNTKKNIKINKKNLCENLRRHKLSSRTMRPIYKKILSNHNSSILFTTITDNFFIDVMKNLLFGGGKITQIIVFDCIRFLNALCCLTGVGVLFFFFSEPLISAKLYWWK